MATQTGSRPCPIPFSERQVQNAVWLLDSVANDCAAAHLGLDEGAPWAVWREELRVLRTALQAVLIDLHAADWRQV